MIEIHVQLYSILREKLPVEARGRTTLRFEGQVTLADVLRRLDIGRRVVISVNGEHEADNARPLRDGDEVKIFSSVGGGALLQTGAPPAGAGGAPERRRMNPPAGKRNPFETGLSEDDGEIQIMW